MLDTISVQILEAIHENLLLQKLEKHLFLGQKSIFRDFDHVHTHSGHF